MGCGQSDKESTPTFKIAFKLISAFTAERINTTKDTINVYNGLNIEWL